MNFKLALVGMALLAGCRQAPEGQDAEFEPLMNFLMEFAEQQVKKQGSFVPFGGAVDGKDGIVPVMTVPDEQGGTEAAIEAHWKALAGTAKKEAYKAVAVCYDVRIMTSKGKRDAICVDMELADGSAQRFTEAYWKEPVAGWAFDHVKATPLKARVFPLL